MNLQLLDLQLYGQQIILEEAGSEAVLKGEAKGIKGLEQLIGRKRAEIERYQSMYDDGEGWIAQMEQEKLDIPLDTLRKLYRRPEEMNDMMDELLTHLEESLCGSHSPYTDEEKRKPLVEAYEACLDAYGRCCYLEVNQVIACLDQESRDMVLDSISEMQVFKEYMLSYPLSGQSGDELEQQLRAAHNQLEDAVGELKMQNYRLEAAGWR